MMTSPTRFVGPFRGQCSAPGASGAGSRSGPCRRISLASRLPSRPSAFSFLILFGSFVGTMHLLDSLPPCMKGLPLRVPLPARRLAVLGRWQGLPVLAHGVSLHAWGLRLRRIGRALAFFVHCRVAF